MSCGPILTMLLSTCVGKNVGAWLSQSMYLPIYWLSNNCFFGCKLFDKKKPLLDAEHATYTEY